MSILQAVQNIITPDTIAKTSCLFISMAEFLIWLINEVHCQRTVQVMLREFLVDRALVGKHYADCHCKADSVIIVTKEEAAHRNRQSEHKEYPSTLFSNLVLGSLY
jgi:hypothetical protein